MIYGNLLVYKFMYFIYKKTNRYVDEINFKVLGKKKIIINNGFIQVNFC